jgi:Mg-chelatase subunit ChlD
MRILSAENRLRALVLFLACTPALGGECSNPTVSLNSVDRDLTVHRDIRADDLEVTVDGERARVVSLSLDSRPRRIVMMVDSSGSMGASPQNSGWGTSLRTAAFAADSVPANASVALMTFGDRLLPESNGFEGRQQIGRAVLALAKRRPKGHTALFDSIDEALSLFEEPQLGDTIFLITDGDDDKSKTSLAKLRESLVAHGVRVFVFLVQHEGFVPAEGEEGASRMGQLAEFTGGYVIRIPRYAIRDEEQEWLAKSAPQIARQVEGIYQIGLDFSGTFGSKARVKVAFIERKREKNTRLAYPRQLAPCPRKPQHSGKCVRNVAACTGY